jgi:outer membrane protein insertion porin family
MERHSPGSRRLSSGAIFLYGLLAAVPVFGQNAQQAAPKQGPVEQVPAVQPQDQLGSGVIEAIEVRGARRIPQDVLRVIISSKVGDPYNQEAVRRDLKALWDTHRFDDIQLETGKGDHGGTIVRFVVKERPVIRDVR